MTRTTSSGIHTTTAPWRTEGSLCTGFAIKRSIG
jgi:hypothetical protein